MAPVPPDPVAVAEPSAEPLQRGSVTVVVTDTATGSVTETVVVAVHPLASVAVTV